MAELERVLLVHDYGGTRGGAEILYQKIRASLRGRGFDARLMASDADPFGEEDAPDYVFKGSTGPFRSLRETANFSARAVGKTVIRDFQPQVAHLGVLLTQASPLLLPCIAFTPSLLLVDDFRPICPNGTRLLPDGRICEVSPGIPCLAGGCFRLRGWIPRMAQLQLLARWIDSVDLVLAPSHAMAKTLKNSGFRVDRVVPHGVDTAQTSRPELSSTPVLAYAGRLSREKGVETLLRAFSEVWTIWPESELWVLGDGPDRAFLEEIASRHPSSQAVHFFGHRSWEEAQRILSRAWIQCVPSLWNEPFGLVTTEGQARGSVVVASRVGAQPELIRHGETGFLVDPGDPGAWARELTSLLADPAHLRTVGRRGQEMVRAQHDWEAMIDSFVDIYRKLSQGRTTS